MLTTDNPDLAKLAQTALSTKGYYHGLIDGQWGPLSQAAFNTYVAQNFPHPAVQWMDAPWMQFAQGEIGVHEIAGAKDNPRIVEYASATSLGATDDETPWCSAFVNWCLKQAGIAGTNNAMARSFLDWGVKLPTVRPGCIVVFARGTGSQGHVAFFESWGPGGSMNILGGNQNDQVCIESTGTAHILGYRWPTSRSA